MNFSFSTGQILRAGVFNTVCRPSEFSRSRLSRFMGTKRTRAGDPILSLANSFRNGRSSSSSSSALSRSQVMIGIAGGTASGKTTLCQEIIKRLHVDGKLVGVISQDAFYRNLTDQEKARAYRGDFNFDHPDALDCALLLDTLEMVRRGESVSVPIYDFRTHSRVPNKKLSVGNVSVLLVEGILVFYFEAIRQMFDIKLFVDVDADIRLERRIRRDVSERGRELMQILHQYMAFVKPAYEEFCLPTKNHADLIIPRGSENLIAVEMITRHIQDLLRESRKNGQLDPISLPI